jgi:hypothetical protein
MKTVKANSIIFPRAFAFAIDDLGWNEGSDLSNNIPSGPFRVGVKRSFDLNDYKYIVDVASAIGVRVQCLFVLAEMDRENVLAKYPTTTQERTKWNNSHRKSDKQIEIMKFVQNSAAFMEFGLHGTGHEFWTEEGVPRRAEWYNLIERQPWPEEILRGHIKAFGEIMAQYGFSPDKGHSFPESFVACAYSFYWNPQGDYSLGKLMAEAGVKYGNTDFGQIPELSPPAEVNGGGFDHGIHVINRMNFGNDYYELNSLPKVPIDLQGTDVIESHWANWLAQDDFLQQGVTEKFIGYYRQVQQRQNRYLAKNTEQLHSQWLYKKYTLINEAEIGIVEIDNTQMPEEAYTNNILGNLVLKLKLDAGKHVSAAGLDGNLIPAYFEAEGFAFLYLPQLKRKKYRLLYTTGDQHIPLHIYNDGTYNVYELNSTGKQIRLSLKMYGRQTVKIICDKPEKINSQTRGLIIENFSYHRDTRALHLEIRATDIQGTRGEIQLFY